MQNISEKKKNICGIEAVGSGGLETVSIRSEYRGRQVYLVIDDWSEKSSQPDSSVTATCLKVRNEISKVSWFTQFTQTLLFSSFFSSFQPFHQFGK